MMRRSTIRGKVSRNIPSRLKILSKTCTCSVKTSSENPGPSLKENRKGHNWRKSRVCRHITSYPNRRIPHITPTAHASPKYKAAK